MRLVEKCLVGGWQWCFEIQGGIRLSQPPELQMCLGVDRNQISTCVENVNASK